MGPSPGTARQLRGKGFQVRGHVDALRTGLHALAALLLAADFHDLFVLPSLRRLWPCLGDVCGWLAKPIPMALVTLGASLALPRDSARLPVVVNLAAALLLGMALERLPGARGFALLRLTPETARSSRFSRFPLVGAASSSASSSSAS